MARKTKLTSNLGMLLLGILLILNGLTQLGVFSISGIGIITAVLGIAAGILIIIGR